MSDTPNPADEALARTAPDPAFDPRASVIVADLYSNLLGAWERNRTYRDYVRGRHALAFATAKWKTEFGKLFGKLRNNYCRRVVETLSDYVRFEAVETGNESADSTLSAWFALQRIDAVQDRIHTDAFQYGEAFGIVSVDPADEKRLRFYRQQPGTVAAAYDPEQPDRLLVALKLWRTLGNSWRLNVYTLDGVYRYETGKVRRPVGSEAENPTALAPARVTAFRPLLVEPFVANLLDGRLPVFHWPNVDEDGVEPVSELDDVIPLQDALNKLLADAMVASEFQSFRQRWATGIEAEIDEKTGKPKPLDLDTGANRLLFSDSKDARFGEFGQLDVTGPLKAMNDLRLEIARVSRIPPHHLSMVDNFPSGEALKTAEAPLQAKISDRVRRWGNVYEDLASYVLEAMGESVDASTLSSKFGDTTPRSRKEEAEADDLEVATALSKVKLGVSKAEALRELGYDDAKQKSMAKEKAAEDAAAAETARLAFEAQTVAAGRAPASPGVAPGAPGATA